ncbi:MAG: 4Fe-4S binding protein [Candidatus Fibromonas sp.]|jgi:NADH-quinone oxidoreductase subunit I|nr:4Fe-4S binding protein [Candidatus Fibromonas sp.]
MMTVSKYFTAAVTGPVSLLKGLSVTLRYFFNPKRIVTEQYPENRATLKMHERFRGRVELIHDENGRHACTACGICEKSCPNSSINVLTTKNMAGKRVLGQYLYRLDTCTQCGFCVENCPFGCLGMTHDFETCSTDRKTLNMVLNKSEGQG